jgi:hypothetical protein
MLIKSFFLKISLPIYTACLFISPTILVCHGMANDIPWQELETKYTIIHYQAPEDLYQLNNKVDYIPQSTSLTWIFSNVKKDPFTDRIKKNRHII